MAVPGEPAVSALIRATLFVRDLDRASAVYRALGLNEIYYEGVLDDPSATSLLGLPHHHPYPVRILKRPGPNYGMVGLFQISSEAGAESLALPAGPARMGEVALIFYVPDLSATLTRLRAAGASWSPEPQLFRMPGFEQREVCVRDADGILVNLIERNPDEQERLGRETG